MSETIGTLDQARAALARDDIHYLAFWGEVYYPSGGWRDPHRGFSTLDAARGFADGVLAQNSLGWAHVVDLSIGEIVYTARA